MTPAEVVTAQTEYSVWPRKYRLSKTLTGSACHVSRAGGPGGRAAVPRPRCGVEVPGGTASVQMRLKTPAKSAPAAAFAAATCAWTASVCAPATASAATESANAHDATVLMLVTDGLLGVSRESSRTTGRAAHRA